MVSKAGYLSEIKKELVKTWPDNRTVNIICHGHSVPSGYFLTPDVRTFESYPHLTHVRVKEAYPYAVMNFIVTAIGGETSPEGAARFERDVLSHCPDAVTIDYGLNDRRAGLEAAGRAWGFMAGACKERGIPVIFLTPTWDMSFNEQDDNWKSLAEHAEQIRRLACEFGVALSDSFAAFDEYIKAGGSLDDLLSQPNHPSKAGHILAAGCLAEWFV